MKKILIIVFFVFLVFGITSCSEDKKYSLIQDRNKLTEIVYDLVNDVEPIKQISNNKLSNNKKGKFNPNSKNIEFGYLEVIVAFKFNMELETSLTPYFELDNDGTLKLECMIVGIDLIIDPDDYEYRFQQCMLILSKDDVHYGFLSPLSGVNFLKDIFPSPLVFSSHMFLSGNEMVSYYEKGETVYRFECSFDKEILTSCELIEHRIPKDISVDYISVFQDVSIDYDSYKQMSTEKAYDFVNQTKVEKVVIEATIKGLRPDSRLNVSSKECPTLKTVSFNKIVDSLGNDIYDCKFIAGTKVELYYYRRTPSYIPEDIHVYLLVLK
jgi:hypothetical protein